MEFLETARLRGEPVRVEVAEELAQLMLDPEVYPWLWERQDPPSFEDVVSSARVTEAHWERFGFGLWLLRDRATDEVVGRGGLQWASPPELPQVEVAWAIVSDRWGEGLATELGLASVQAGFEYLELDELIAFTLVHNHASRRVMDKVGFTYERDLEVASLPHALYRLSR